MVPIGLVPQTPEMGSCILDSLGFVEMYNWVMAIQNLSSVFTTFISQFGYFALISTQ